MSPDASHLQDAGAAIIPLLAVDHIIASQDIDEDAGQTATRVSTETATVTDVGSADQPVAIPDDLLIRSTQNATTIKLVKAVTQEAESYFTTGAAPTDTAEMYPFTAKSTTAANDSFRIATTHGLFTEAIKASENESRAKNTPGSLK